MFLVSLISVTGSVGHGQSNTASVPASTRAKDISTSERSYTAALETCKRLISEQKLSEAQKKCTSTVSLAEALPAKAWRERSVAYLTRGTAELSTHDADDAAQDFKKATDIDEKNLRPHDPALAADYAGLGRAQLQLGDLENLNFADQSLQKAIEVLEESMLNDPAKKSQYEHTAKGILLDYAKVKRALGEESLALALEQQSESIP
jgi:tetratricopeptide (TPR) repeat protein